MNQKYEALKTLLMLRQGAVLSTKYHASEMAFSIGYDEWDECFEAQVARFCVTARTWDNAMEQAEAAAVAYIEKVTGG